MARQALVAVMPRACELPVRYAHAWLTGHLEHELAVVARCLGVGDVAVDVGANVGLYAFALARRGAFVHAFEPVRACREVIEAYAHPRIEVHSEALSDRPGRMAMQIPVWRGNRETALARLVPEVDTRDAEGVEAVDVRTLDSYGFTRVDLLKIDVEGHEHEVLSGARSLIASCKPALLVETEQRRLRGITVRDLAGEVSSLGYEGYFFLHGRAHRASEFDVTEHQERWVHEIDTRGFSSHYVNNFLFLPVADSRWRKALD